MNRESGCLRDLSVWQAHRENEYRGLAVMW